MSAAGHRAVHAGPPADANWLTTCCINRMMKKRDKGVQTYAAVSPGQNEKRTRSAGQSGDTQGLSDVAEAGDLSVEELTEEGQFLEADAISGVEDAPDADVAEVHTKQVPEDDVPLEYQQGD